MDGIALSPAVDADGYRYIVAAGMSCSNGIAGHPSLPSLSRLVQLPRGSRLSLDDVNGREQQRDYMEADTWRLRPVDGPTVKDAPEADLLCDEKIYTADAWYRGGEPLTLEHLGTMGQSEVYRLTVRPVSYNPVRHNLRYYPSLTATLAATGSTLLTSGAPQVGERYLVVSRPQFREGLQPFVRWKRQQGYVVAELYADTNLRDSVRALIGRQWTANGGMESPRYVLLVGDVAQLQSFPGTTHPAGLSNHITDLYYVEHTGDYLPDALVGRWPVNDTAELGAVVRKTLAYERGADLDSSRLTRVLLVAGAESQEPAPVTTNGQVNYLSCEVKQARPLLDTVAYRNPASADQLEAILGDLRQGAALLNYTAHCTANGWSSPAVTFASIDTLDNPQPLLYVNNCCLSNAFGGTCFGEQLLRKADGGAIGVIGATNSTLWNEDYYWAVGPKYPLTLEPAFDDARPGAFDRWIGRADGVRTQGELLAAGNLAVSAFGSPYDKFYWETYCLLGDPSLEPWVGVPQPLDLHVTDLLPRNGDGSLHVGGTPGATVTAMQGDTVLGRGLIEPNGELTLVLNRSIDTLPLTLTATASGRLPRVDTLAVLSATGRGVALRDVTVTDSTVVCRVEHVGTLPLYGLQVALRQSEDDITAGAVVAEQQQVVDTLLPTQSRQVTLPLQVLAVWQQPLWRAQLQAYTDGEEVLCSVGLEGYVDVYYPAVAFRLAEPDGGSVYTLDTRSNYRLETNIEGSFDSMALAVAALPTGDILFDTTLHASLSTLHTPLSTPDTLTHLRVQSTLILGNHRADRDQYLVGGHRMDSFEDGFASYPWQGRGTQPWVIDSAVRHSGRFSARSGAIDYRQTSDLVLEVLLPQQDTLSYWARTSSEVTYDKLVFTVDGERRGIELWGEANWRRCTVVLDAGRHTLRWRYVKDESGSAGNDCAWIDDVRLPLAWWDAPYGWFGDTTSVGIADVDPETLCIYPNPSRGTVTVKSSAPGRLQVTDLVGREVYSAQHDGYSTLRLDYLPDGIYLLQVTSAAGRSQHKLIIRHQP